MKTRWVVVLAAGLWLFVHGAPPASASGQEPSTAPAYSNVEVVSIDAATRLVVVKDAKGTRETLELDES